MADVHWKGNVPHRSSISVTVDELGIAEVTEVWQCRNEAMAAAKLDVTASDCPLGLTRPRVKATSADRMEGGLWQVTLTFSAVLEEGLIGDRRIYKCTTIANKEPIQTHPNFKKFAGDVGNPINGAVYDAQNNFERFKPYLSVGEKYTPVSGTLEVQTATQNMKNRKCGVTDYLCPIVHLSETKLVFEEDLDKEIEKLATIDKNTPNTALKPHWPKRTWMLTKADPQWVAERVYKLNKEWSLSGPRGWDADIYTR